MSCEAGIAEMWSPHISMGSSFCDLHLSYQVDVNGEGAHPVFKFLKAETPSNMGKTGDLEWNFNKFVVSIRTGCFVGL